MLKLSIYPKCKAHPTKEEKTSCAIFASKPYQSTIIDIESDEDLFQAITNNSWSPCIFKDGYRSKINFLFTDWMVLDIDTGLKIQEAEYRCEKYNLTALICPTVSHTIDHHKFRIIFPLSQRIDDPIVFHDTWNKLEEIFPELDGQCSDEARFYYGCLEDSEQCIYIERNLLNPVIDNLIYIPQKFENTINDNFINIEDVQNQDILEFLYDKKPNKVPETVVNFIDNAHTGMPGEWIMSLNACVFTMGLQKLPYQKIYAIIEKLAPHPLDDRDIFHIENAYNDAQKEKNQYDKKNSNLW